MKTKSKKFVVKRKTVSVEMFTNLVEILNTRNVEVVWSSPLAKVITETNKLYVVGTGCLNSETIFLTEVFSLCKQHNVSFYNSMTYLLNNVDYIELDLTDSTVINKLLIATRKAFYTYCV